MLANPVLDSNVGSPCPWEGVSRMRPIFNFAWVGRSEVDLLRERFAASVARCLGTAETVVVLFSGGLDSLALLVEVAHQCAADGRRLVPVVCDVVDDTGRSVVDVVHRQAKAIPECLPVVVLPAYEPGESEPAWSAVGPRSECHIGFVHRVYELAQSFPAPVVLDGEGGDEALSAWNYGARDLITARHRRDLLRYMGAFVRHQTLVEVLGEGVALTDRWLPARRSFRWYMALTWPAMLRIDPGGAVGSRFQEAVKHEHRRWLGQRFDVFQGQRQSWEQAMFFDQVYPYAYDAHPVDAPVPHLSPYLDHEFLAFCVGLPWHYRFDSRFAAPYWWYKALQLRLIPESLHAVAAGYKMRYSKECRRHLQRTAPQAPLELQRLGVLQLKSQQELAAAHGFLPLVVRNAEMWLRGALERGFPVVE